MKLSQKMISVLLVPVFAMATFTSPRSYGLVVAGYVIYKGVTRGSTDEDTRKAIRESIAVALPTALIGAPVTVAAYGVVSAAGATESMLGAIGAIVGGFFTFSVGLATGIG